MGEQQELFEVTERLQPGEPVWKSLDEERRRDVRLALAEMGKLALGGPIEPNRQTEESDEP
jgi:hypothetical protein